MIPFFPSALAESVDAISYDALYAQGIRGVIFDIDNTLVHHGDPVTAQVQALLARVHAAGLATLVLSDNSEARVRDFAWSLGTLFIANAGKPKPDGYLRALEMLGLHASEVVAVGDQIFRDVWGAHRAGVRSILVPYLRKDPHEKAGKKRALEQGVLALYRLSGQRPSVQTKEDETVTKRRLSDLHPALYELARRKGIVARHLADRRSGVTFASEQIDRTLPHLVSSHDSTIIKKGKGIDPVLQENKGVNIGLASASMNKLVIHPGEVFSFWRLVGPATPSRGFKDGRVMSKGQLVAGTGGGLCNLANSINLLALHSPMTIVEFHTHSDALAPDQGERQPLSSGTSVAYNYVDFRFKNTTDQDVQLLLWIEDGKSRAELRSEHPFEHDYRLVEEDHHFEKEGADYYRVSKIYRETLNRESGEVVERELIWDNHSRVMFDHSQIPAELIREPRGGTAAL